MAWVFIVTNGPSGTLYIGVTADLIKRVWEHRTGAEAGFTRRNGCKILVWYEAFEGIADARLCELQMKKWKRQWKLAEIEG